MKTINFVPPDSISLNPVYSNAIRIIKVIRDAGHTAYIAGGFVRDLILERLDRNDFDIDIATEASPEKIKSLFKNTIEVGIQFGVIIVIKNGHQYQIATFRKDDEYLDGRRPKKVIFTEPEIDAKRRDFTINGLFFDPVCAKIMDYVGGLSDTKKGVIRAIGDPFQRISEDRLRMLRAVRFSAVLGFRIEDATLRAIISENDRIRSVSGERISEELKKALLYNPRPSRFINLLDESGLLSRIIPEILPLKDIATVAGTNTVLGNILIMLDNNAFKDDLAIIFAILLHKTGAEAGTGDPLQRSCSAARKVLSRLRFKNNIIKDAVDIIQSQSILAEAKDFSSSEIKRFYLKPNILKHLEFLRTSLIAEKKDPTPYLNALNAYILLQKTSAPEPLINGRDLIMLGIEKGPVYSEIIDHIFNLQLEDKIGNKAEAIDYIRKKYHFLFN